MRGRVSNFALKPYMGTSNILLHMILMTWAWQGPSNGERGGKRGGEEGEGGVYVFVCVCSLLGLNLFGFFLLLVPRNCGDGCEPTLGK